MPVYVDFELGLYANGTMSIAMAPPTPIGGWDIQYTMWKRAGMPNTSGLVIKYLSSGFTGVSGISIVESGLGQFNVSFSPLEVSGLDPGAYFFRIERTTSGACTGISEGYRIMEP